MKKHFSVQEWVNVPSEKDTNTNEVAVVPKIWNGTSSTADDVERIVRMIEAKRVDIAPSYEQWVKVGFAFSSEFGKNGRGYFSRISQFHPDVTQKAIDKQYNKCLSNKRSGITIATFFLFAKDAGIDISKPKQMASEKPVDCKDASVCQEPISVQEPNGFLDFWSLLNRPTQLLLEYKPTLSMASFDRPSANQSATEGLSEVDAKSDDLSHGDTHEYRLADASSSRQNLQDEEKAQDKNTLDKEPMVLANDASVINEGCDIFSQNSLSDKYSNNTDNETITTFKDSNVSLPVNAIAADSAECSRTKKPKNHSTVIGSKWVLDEDELPHFPDFIYDILPHFFKDVIASCIATEDRDMLLMGSMTCISSTLNNVYGRYDGNDWYPMLYYFVMAEAGMGKGSLIYCRQLVAPINAELRENSEQQIREFKENQKLMKQDGGHASGEEPKRRTLFIPTDSSASAFVEQLDNNGGIGLLFDTECDTLSAVLKSDYGNYSSYIRKAYHHEPIELSRRKDNEFRCIEKPMLAMCLSGTPEQLHTLTPDAENGLFSRISTYHIPFKAEFRDTLVEDAELSTDTFSIRDSFYQLGLRYKCMREAFFRGGTYRVVIPSHLCSVFNPHFRLLNQQTVDDVSNAMQGVVRRIAFAVFRIMMILTAIRFMDENANPSALSRRDGKPVRLVCSDDDFRIALAIGDTLIYHSAYCYAHLPKTQSTVAANGRILSKLDKMNMLYDALPDSFDKAQFKEVSIELKFSPHTTSKWINDFIVQGRLVRDAKDKYAKSGI